MSDDRSSDEVHEESDAEETKRRRRRARVFGDVLPDRTRDETSDPGEDSPGVSEDWLRRQRPPHHD